MFLNVIDLTPSYALLIAVSRVAPVAATERTRPPAVKNCSLDRCVPAWNNITSIHISTVLSCLSRHRVIAFIYL